MKTIKTQSNSIIVVEVPEDVINWQSLDVSLDWSKHKILGKLSELSEEDCVRLLNQNHIDILIMVYTEIIIN